MPEKLSQVSPNILLRDQRQQREWTQAHVAELLGVAELTIRRWEQGKSKPSGYYIQKLCALFEVSQQELGLAPTAQSMMTNAEAGLENLSEPDIKSEAPSDTHGNDALGDIRDNREAALPVHRHFPWLRKWQTYIYVSLAIILCIGCLFYLNEQILLPHKLSSSTPPSQTSQLLYQANWSENLAGWTASHAWHWSKQDHGMLATDNTTNSLAIAPYHPATPNYIIEARIQRLSYSNMGGNAFGLVIRQTSSGGYISGIGVHEVPEHFFIGQLAMSGVDKKPYIPGDLKRVASNVDDGWHVYRVEVDKGHISAFFDGKLVIEANDYTQLAAGQVGLYASGAIIHIENFKVYAL